MRESIPIYCQCNLSRVIYRYASSLTGPRALHALIYVEVENACEDACGLLHVSENRVTGFL